MSHSLRDSWRRLTQGAAPAPNAALTARLDPAFSGAAPVAIDRVAMLSAAFPAEFPIAETVTTRVLEAITGVNLSSLARRSPGLAGFDWVGYLRCSVARVVRVQRALALHVPGGGRVLDFGSYFGNFALACRAAGFEVDAIDAYREYGAAFASCVSLQQHAGIAVHDFADSARCLPAGNYDAVICAGVIEHIPHTPRQLLTRLTALMKPGGVLVLDTPNLAYLYRRLALLEGQTVFSPIAQQFYTELPFEGHHREYTVAEVEWMLRASGHDLLSVETFNYSVFAQAELSGDHADYFRAMRGDATLREIIMAVSRRTA